MTTDHPGLMADLRAPAHAHPRTPAPDPRRPPRVLVIDDNPTLRDLLVQALRRAGLTVDEAWDGTRALGEELIRAAGPLGSA